jgi:hypothetical protein
MNIVSASVGVDIPSIMVREMFGWVEFKGSKTIYVGTEDCEVIILAPTAFTPYTITLSQSWQKIHELAEEGAEVVFKKDGITLGNDLHIAFRGIDGPPHLPKGVIPPIEMIHLAHRIQNILLSSLNMESVLVEGAAIVRQYDHPDSHRLLKSLMNLIGVGSGMTPAGDDFASGVLLALHTVGIDYEARPLVDHAAEVSRWPSWRMLEHSSHGCTYRHLVRLYHAMVEGDPDAVVDGVVHTMSLGSSSGSALLTGFLETLTVFYPVYPSNPAQSPVEEPTQPPPHPLPDVSGSRRRWLHRPQ